MVPGIIITVHPRKQWSYSGHPYLSGEYKSSRIDVGALGLVPLELRDEGDWDPSEEYCGEEGEPIADWASAIIRKGLRPQFEMEQVLPREDPNNPDEDPITRSSDMKNAGEADEARHVRMEALESDVRCLDAHAHLGNMVFDDWPQQAVSHYEIGKAIGELFLGDDFDGVLHWGLIDNRPFLRCNHGFGLCLWRLGRFSEAERHFERMLSLNPSDNQGIRFLVASIAGSSAHLSRFRVPHRAHRSEAARRGRRTRQPGVVVSSLQGLEKDATTIRLAKKNLAVHGLEDDIQQAITYYEDPHELVDKADYRWSVFRDLEQRNRLPLTDHILKDGPRGAGWRRAEAVDEISEGRVPLKAHAVRKSSLRLALKH